MRILVIEDEVKLANAIQRALQLQNYAVDVAYDGEAGLDMAIGEKLDLIITDVMLPKLSGVELCAEVRAHKVTTPILMLTAKGQISDKVSGLDAGADDYMVKPFSFEELFARVRAMIRRASKNEDPVLTVSDLTLHPTTFVVIRGEHTLKLSSKEFAILEYLMRHKDSIISKEQIVNHVWNYDANILPSTVEVHIKNLRDKVDKKYPTPLLHTVRGFGYMIGEKS